MKAKFTIPLSVANLDSEVEVNLKLLFFNIRDMIEDLPEPASPQKTIIDVCEKWFISVYFCSITNTHHGKNRMSFKSKFMTRQKCI